jgi:hypothetical protein
MEKNQSSLLYDILNAIIEIEFFSEQPREQSRGFLFAPNFHPLNNSHGFLKASIFPDA